MNAFRRWCCRLLQAIHDPKSVGELPRQFDILSSFAETSRVVNAATRCPTHDCPVRPIQCCSKEEAQRESDAYYDDLPSSRGDGDGGGGSDDGGGSRGSADQDGTALPPVAEDKSLEYSGGGHIEEKGFSPQNANAVASSRATEAGERTAKAPDDAEHAGQVADSIASSEGGAQAKEGGESRYFSREVVLDPTKPVPML